MRVREARLRDAKTISEMLPDTEKMTESEVMDIIQKKEVAIFVGTDFGANILGCSFGKDKVYISSKCIEPDAEDTLRKMYE